MNGSHGTLYMSVAAQEDNLGDILIRRECLRLLGAKYDKCVIYAGDMSHDYIDAFSLPSSVRVVRDAKVFGTLLLRDTIGRCAALVFAPGPHTMPTRGLPVVKAMSRMILGVAVRLFGGEVMSAGRAIRRSSRSWSFPERTLARVCSTYTVRDVASKDALGILVQEQPDFGLMVKPVSMKENVRQNTIAISLRADRGVRLDAVTALVADLRGNGFEPIFVSQVRRDDALHSELASMATCEAVLWGELSHREQEKRIIDCYATSHAVVSNRLHAVIYGSVCGAFPVSAAGVNDDKIESTLSGIVDVPKADLTTENPQPIGKLLRTIDEADRLRLLDGVEQARHELLAMWSD